MPTRREFLAAAPAVGAAVAAEERVPVIDTHLAERPAAKPGSKQAVLRHFGVFKDDADLEKQLADLRARRERD